MPQRSVQAVVCAEFFDNGGRLRRTIALLQRHSDPSSAQPRIWRLTVPAVDSALIEESPMNFTLECEQEHDGRWLAEVLDLPGALAYGGTKDGAMAKAEALALRVVAERLEHGEASPMAITISLPAAASAKSMSAIPQLVRGIPALALGPGIPARMTRQVAKLPGRHSGRMPESRAMDGNLTASAEVRR